MNLIEEITTGRQQLSELRDPFTVAGFSAMHIFVNRGYFDKTTISYSASVKFESGPTKGEHDVKAASFPELLQRLEAFLKTIPQ